jgi:exodeoxyribonuclease VII large subunit
VIRDILNIFERRFPGLEIRIYPAAVQGEGSVEGVCKGLRYFSESGWADVVVLARGGGSLEDLWTFNEEVVARTIASSSIPVISAIGHETDFTIADFVADLRAPTPSAAAELVICTREQLIEQVVRCTKTLEQAIRYRLTIARQKLNAQGVERGRSLLHRRIGRSIQRVDDLERSAIESMRRRLREASTRVVEADTRLQRMDLRVRLAVVRRKLESLRHNAEGAIRLRLARACARLDPLRGELAQLSPLRVLDRGYAIVHDPSGHVLRDADRVRSGDDLRIRLAKGELSAVVASTQRVNAAPSDDPPDR